MSSHIKCLCHFLKSTFQSPWIDAAAIFIIQAITITWIKTIIFTPVGVASDDWQSLHNYYFQGAIFTAFLTLIPKLSILRCIWLGLLFGYVSEECDLLDETLHNFLDQSGIYRSIGQDNFVNNPQYGILFAYFVAVLSHLVHLLFKRLRRFTVFLSFLYLLIQLTIAFVNHAIFPSGIMKDIIADRIATIRLLPTDREEHIRLFCETHKLTCRVKSRDTISTIHAINYDLDDEQRETLKNLEKNIYLPHDYSFLETNKLRAYYYTHVRLKDNKTFDVFDHIYINRAWSLSLGYFSRNCLFISNLWFIFMSLLIYIHRKVIWFK